MPASAARALKPVALATDCSGMETPVMALKNLGVDIDHVFSCDFNKHAKATIMANFPPSVFYDDLTQRDHSKAPKSDLYVAGFPCQPFSSAGKQEGFADKKGRGTIFFQIREYVEAKQPAVFVLENVSGLVKLDGGRYYKDIMESLEELGNYNIQAKILDTRDHGIPQYRRRIYFVGIKKSRDKKTFEFPEPLPRVSIEEFLEPRKRRPDEKTDLPPKSQGTARGNVKTAIKDLKAKGFDPLKEAFIIDCDSSAARMKYMRDYTPCLTCSRGGGHWVTNRGRRMTKREMMRLQGMMTTDDGFKVAVSDCQLGRQIGNAMSVNVLERLFARLLPAAGLVPEGRLKDQWEAKAKAKAAEAAAAAAAAEAANNKKRAAPTNAPTRSLLKRRRST